MTRSGIGYDIHRLEAGLPLTLGGVRIEHTHGLVGHSDADVLSHAIADAILGALGLQDIGYYFPNSDPEIAGISSLKIVSKCTQLATEAGAVISNIDATLIAEAPKIGPHIGAMKNALAEALSISPQQVGIKATTNELLGSIGREEGMAAMAVACVEIADDR